jgi:hypothetical protein
MRLAIVKPEDAEGWMWAEASVEEHCAVAWEIPSPACLDELWTMVANGRSIGEVLIDFLPEPKRRTRDEVGILLLNPEFLADLAALDRKDRWKFAEGWCRLRLEKNGTKEQVAWHKQAFHSLCELAEGAASTKDLVAVIQGMVEL